MVNWSWNFLSTSGTLTQSWWTRGRVKRQWPGRKRHDGWGTLPLWLFQLRTRPLFSGRRVTFFVPSTFDELYYSSTVRQASNDRPSKQCEFRIPMEEFDTTLELTEVELRRQLKVRRLTSQARKLDVKLNQSKAVREYEEMSPSKPRLI